MGRRSVLLALAPVHVGNSPMKMRPSLIGTTLGRLLAAAGLIALLPIFVIAGILIMVEDGWPVFFTQRRVGLGGRTFSLLKLRSMRTTKAGPSITSAHDNRLTRVGRILRLYKIDEIPQLWNILCGDMSFIGPRPEVPAYVNGSDPAWQHILSVRPGLTDLASIVYRHEEDLFPAGVNVDQFYRNELLPRKLALSAFYLRTRSVSRDLRLILLTMRYSIAPAGFDADAIASRFGYSIRT
jgi:lipopolysaccharide/colanic/teichoic acid biosynthesis glycosyltransferase